MGVLDAGRSPRWTESEEYSGATTRCALQPHSTFESGVLRNHMAATMPGEVLRVTA